MKKTIVILSIILLAFTPEKKYNVYLSVNEWQKSINIIEYTKQVLKASNSPANIVLPLCDSLTKIQNEFIEQIKPQIADSVTKKK